MVHSEQSRQVNKSKCNYKEFMIQAKQTEDGKWSALVINPHDSSKTIGTLEYGFEEYAVAEAKNIIDGLVPNKRPPF